MGKGMSYKAGYCAARRGIKLEDLRKKDADTLRGWEKGWSVFKLKGATEEPLGFCDCGNKAVRRKSKIPVCQRCLDIEATYESAVKTRHDYAYSGKERGGWE